MNEVIDRLAGIRTDKVHIALALINAYGWVPEFCGDTSTYEDLTRAIKSWVPIAIDTAGGKGVAVAVSDARDGRPTYWLLGAVVLRNLNNEDHFDLA